MMGSNKPLFEKLSKLPSKKELETSIFVDGCDNGQDDTMDPKTLDLSKLTLPEIKLRKNKYINEMQWYGSMFHRCKSDFILFDLVYYGTQKQQLWLKRPLPITCNLCKTHHPNYKSYYDHCHLARHCEQICRFYNDNELPEKFLNSPISTPTEINAHSHTLTKNLKFLKIPKKQLITLFTLLLPSFIPKELSKIIIIDYLLGPHFLKCIQTIQSFKSKTKLKFIPDTKLKFIIEFLDYASMLEYKTNGIYGNLCCIRTRMIHGWTPDDVKIELGNIPMIHQVPPLKRPSKRSDIMNYSKYEDLTEKLCEIIKENRSIIGKI